MSTNDGGPAFPFGQVSEASGMPINGYHNDGMSLRDYFAAKAMQGFVAIGAIGKYPLDSLANSSYELADAMLAAREAK